MGATPPQTVISSPPNGGNGVIRDPTRRRHADSQLLVLQNPHRHRYGGHRRGRRARAAAPERSEGRAAGRGARGLRGRTTSRRTGRSSRRGRPKRAAPTPPPAKFRMQFPRSTNQHKLKNRRISTIRTQTPTCAHGNCMRNCWLTAIAGHQGDAPNHTSAHRAARPHTQPLRHPNNPRVHKQQPAPHSKTSCPITPFPHSRTDSCIYSSHHTHEFPSRLNRGVSAHLQNRRRPLSGRRRGDHPADRVSAPSRRRRRRSWPSGHP